VPLNVIIGAALICAVASAVNGYLGAGFLLFGWIVLLGIIRDSIIEPVHITEYTWAPHLLLPVLIFLIIWQMRLRGHIGPQFGFRDIFRRPRSAA
jgi:hypothetical protein